MIYLQLTKQKKYFKINIVDVLKETDKSIMILDGNGDNRRYLKSSASTSFYKTFNKLTRSFQHPHKKVFLKSFVKSNHAPIDSILMVLHSNLQSNIKAVIEPPPKPKSTIHAMIDKATGYDTIKLLQDAYSVLGIVLDIIVLESIMNYDTQQHFEMANNISRIMSDILENNQVFDKKYDSLLYRKAAIFIDCYINKEI